MADDSELTEEELAQVNRAWRGLVGSMRTRAGPTMKCRLCAGWHRRGPIEYQRT
jgi:hypothetical protein